MSHEPGSFEVFLTVALGTLLGGMYKEYVDRLGLKGDERVLDLASGSGNQACFIAPLLTKKCEPSNCVKSRICAFC